VGTTCHYFLILELLPHRSFIPTSPSIPNLSHPLRRCPPPPSTSNYSGFWHGSFVLPAAGLFCPAPTDSGGRAALSSQHQLPTTSPALARVRSIAPVPSSPHAGGHGPPFPASASLHTCIRGLVLLSRDPIWLRHGTLRPCRSPGQR
jgi:hypothetical protein